MKIMAIDYGDAHTGIAISDALGMLCGYSTVIDARREEKVLESRAAMLDDPYWAESVRSLFEGIMALSRAEQERLLKAAGEEEA